MSTTQEPSRKTVAVIGSGMAGLVSAFLLANDRRRRYEAEIFEMVFGPWMGQIQDSLSLDSASHTLAAKDGQRPKQDRLDLPMRVFASGYYENLRRMYDYLKVEYTSPKFIYTLSTLPKADAKRKFVWPRLDHTFGEDESLRHYLERIRLPRYYTKNYLLPLMSSVTTCSHDDLLKFPAVDIVDYAKRTFRRPHFLVVGGVRKVQEKLSEKQNVNFGTKVTCVQEVGNKVQVSWITTENDQAHTKLFDYVIMAVTPDVVGSIFSPLRRAMADIPVVPVESIVHYDFTRISHCSNHLKGELRSECAGSSFDSLPGQPIHICSNSSATESVHEHPSSALITTFPIGPIDPEKVVHRAKFTRVLRTTKSRRIVNRVFDMSSSRHSPEGKQQIWKNGDGNVFLVGGWCWDGMVMLEGCVFSAMRMASSLGVEVPWVIERPHAS
ncbi:hypothetical protein EYZ11_007424 [Aspergillus tanneri]|uniref:Amine oxidase domain-containing protein n=1 Tax=Aspergillus tanneri TaxID=1220188 RepID=A0A4S3JCZ0_9EURO|nr:hypothetical protein EYZ11_007424 [Aspergillus tanneri]